MFQIFPILIAVAVSLNASATRQPEFEIPKTWTKAKSQKLSPLEQISELRRSIKKAFTDGTPGSLYEAESKFQALKRTRLRKTHKGLRKTLPVGASIIYLNIVKNPEDVLDMQLLVGRHNRKGWSIMYGGGYDPKKDNSLKATAERELSEESFIPSTETLEYVDTPLYYEEGWHSPSYIWGPSGTYLAIRQISQEDFHEEVRDAQRLAEVFNALKKLFGYSPKNRKYFYNHKTADFQKYAQAAHSKFINLPNRLKKYIHPEVQEIIQILTTFNIDQWDQFHTYPYKKIQFKKYMAQFNIDIKGPMRKHLEHIVYIHTEFEDFKMMRVKDFLALTEDVHPLSQEALHFFVNALAG